MFLDEIRFNIGSKFMRRLVAKILRKLIKRYLECDVELELEELRFAYTDGDVVVKTDIELKMNKKDISKIVNMIDEKI